MTEARRYARDCVANDYRETLRKCENPGRYGDETLLTDAEQKKVAELEAKVAAIKAAGLRRAKRLAPRVKVLHGKLEAARRKAMDGVFGGKEAADAVKAAQEFKQVCYTTEVEYIGEREKVLRWA